MMGLVATNYAYETFGQLTAERPLASLPFGGRYRLIDFPLSNMANSGITTVGLITPYMYRSLMDHVGVGKEWTLSRKVGGMFFLPGSIYGLKNIRGKFLLRDIIQNRVFLERGGRDLVVVSAANKLFSIDYREVARQHEELGADITLLYKSNYVPIDGERESYLELSNSGRVTRIAEGRADGDNCFLDAFIIEVELLLQFLTWYESMGYMDIMEVFAENLDKMNVRGYAFNGYVGNVSGPESYMAVNRDLLKREVRSDLFPEDRTVNTKVQDAAPTIYAPGSRVRNSLVTTGCAIEGTVEDSILFRGVHVAPGAVLKNCVIMQHCEIGPNVELENVICDKYARFRGGVRISGSTDMPIIVSKGQQV